MGYTTQHSGMLIGLGAGSISDAGNAYAQNQKTLQEYYEAVERGELPVFRGWMLDEVGERFKKYILDIICMGYVKPTPMDMAYVSAMNGKYLLQLVMDGFVEMKNGCIEATMLGNHFLRIIALRIYG